jgi:hypothetical protein
MTDVRGLSRGDHLGNGSVVLLGDAAPHVEDDASRGASGEDVGDRPLTESSVRVSLTTLVRP